MQRLTLVLFLAFGVVCAPGLLASPSRDDDQLAERVRRALAQDGLQSVKVRADDGVVVLSGVVESAREKILAIEAAFSIADVEAIDTELRLRVGVTPEVEEEIWFTLFEEGLDSGIDQVIVKNGIASLSGQVVDEATRDRVHSIARQAQGVDAVDSTIVIKSATVAQQEPAAPPPAPAPEPEPVPVLKPELKPEPEPVPEPETVSVAEPELKPEPEPVPVPEPMPEPVPVPEPELEPAEPVSKSEPDPEPDTVPLPEPELKPEPEPVLVPVPEPELEPEPEPKLEPVPVPEPEPELEPEPVSESEPEPEPDTVLTPEPEPELKPEPELEPVPTTSSDEALNLPQPPPRADLPQNIAHQITASSDFTVFDNVQFSLAGSEVILQGSVTSATKKENLERAVASVPGVEGVQNELRVLSDSSGDQNLRERLFRRIYQDPSFAEFVDATNPPIHIIVESKHVTLTGVIDTLILRMSAEAIVRTTFGVRSVRNEIRVRN